MCVVAEASPPVPPGTSREGGEEDGGLHEATGASLFPSASCGGGGGGVRWRQWGAVLGQGMFCSGAGGVCSRSSGPPGPCIPSGQGRDGGGGL